LEIIGSPLRRVPCPAHNLRVNEDSNSGKLDFLAKEALQDQKITDDNFELLKDNPYNP